MQTITSIQREDKKIGYSSFIINSQGDLKQGGNPTPEGNFNVSGGGKIFYFSLFFYLQNLETNKNHETKNLKKKFK